MTDKEIIIAIDRYIRGNLTGEEIDRLWIEFLKNPEYFDWFETDLHLRHLILQEKEKETGPNRIPAPSAVEKVPKKNYRLWAVAAAAVILLAAGLQFFRTGPEDDFHPLAVQQIEEQELMGADVFRSTQDSVSTADTRINRALADAYDRNYEPAIREFQALLEEPLPDQLKIAVYNNLGILHYNEASFENAAESFRALLGVEVLPPYIEEKALWFLGNAYLNLGQTEQAAEALQTAAGLGGMYEQRALDLMQEIRQLQRDTENENSE